jgi:hypothetical protein
MPRQKKLLTELVDKTKHMKIIISDVLIWGEKEQNETEGKLNQWNLIIKEHGQNGE